VSFLNIKHWPTLPPKVFRTQYEQLGMNEAPGLWFRALGAVSEHDGGGTLVVELWADALSWREQHEAERSRASVDKAKADHGAHRPGQAIRSETTSHYLRATEGDPRGRWRESVAPGGMLVAAYPEISVSKYESGLRKHGLDGEGDGGRGVLFAADGPYEDTAWLLARVWLERDDEQEAAAKQLADLRKPDKTQLLLESSVDYSYFVPGCPQGAHNQFIPGLFL